MRYALPPQGEGKALSYRETRTGIPWLIQLWTELTELAALLLVEIVVNLVLIAISISLWPLAYIFSGLIMFALFSLQGIPRYNIFSPMGFRLFSWTIRQR